MKQKTIFLAVISVCLLIGSCANVGISEDDISIEEGSIQKESTISPERCFVCGDTDRSMMSYYSGRDSIGIIHWWIYRCAESAVFCKHFFLKNAD